MNNRDLYRNAFSRVHASGDLTMEDIANRTAKPFRANRRLVTVLTVILILALGVTVDAAAGGAIAGYYDKTIFKELCGKYFYAQEVVYGSPMFSSIPEPEWIRPYYLDENGVLWIQAIKSGEEEKTDPEYEWIEIGQMSHCRLSFRNFDLCFEVEDFNYGEKPFIAEDLADSNKEGISLIETAYRSVWKAARAFRSDNAAAWSVTTGDRAKEGKREIRYYLLVQDDGSFYIASCRIHKGFELGEGIMYRLLKVTADDSE